MVKNTTGGSKHKSQARKNIAGRNVTTSLRVVEQEGECYAHVEKILGGSHMHVVCMDGKTRLCTIRGKFRGRGKRDNRIESGTWVMVGLRDYETSRETGDKLENCDLLEVYKDGDKDRLRNTVRGEDWSKFVARDMERSHIGKDIAGDTLRFVTEEEAEIDNLVAESTGLIANTYVGDNKVIGSSSVISDLDTGDDINVDDI